MKLLKMFLFLWAASLTMVLLSDINTLAQSVRERANRNTVGIISGSVRGTYARFAQDLADALDKEGELRILALLGRGSQQNIADLLWLNGIDVAIVQSDVLAASLEANIVQNISDKIAYITKLYNEEIHILATAEIVSMKELVGKKVSIGGVGSGTAMTGNLVFDALDIPVQPVHLADSQAVAAVRSGEIGAAVFVAGKPASYFSDIPQGTGLHFLKVEIEKKLESRGYISETLSHKDYPNLIEKGTSIETIAVGAVMAVYNWEPTTSRYRRVETFSKQLLKYLPVLQGSDAYHPKWKQVDFRSKVPGWKRFEPVRQLLGIE